METLDKELPLISQKGSKDDMSVACVYDETKLSEYFPLFIHYQEEKLNEQKAEVESDIKKFVEKVVKYSDSREDDKKSQIELHYAKSDLEKSKIKLDKINARLESLKNELDTFNKKLEELNTND